MARGASQSKSTTTRPAPVSAAPRGSAAATAGMRRRRPSGSSNSSSSVSSAGGGGSNILRFYTDDAPGLKMPPYVVLAVGFCFIGVVIALHAFGKFYRNPSAAAA